jgi:hypothetical protein
MKRFFTRLILLFVAFLSVSQNSSAQSYSSQKNRSHKKNIDFNGQWRGGFDEGGFSIPGFDDNIKYVLELTTNGSAVSGYSYTYFQEGMNKYYTICRLTGTLDRDNNDVVVTEVERTKFNTPPDFQNCFQTHRLHYEKDSGNIEILRGTWIAAPGQGAGCGSGTTVLSRRMVSNLPTGFMPHKNNTIAKAPENKTVHKNNSVAKAPEKKHVPTNSVATAPKTLKPSVRKLPSLKKLSGEKNEVQKADTIKGFVPKNDLSDTELSKSKITAAPPVKGFAIRRKDIVRTIALENPTFKLAFYDNGVVDGDSISVFYNGKLVLSHQMLSEKPISLELTLDKNIAENIVTMYADNLGTIPPNTALMIVTDGSKRYEVRMESDTEKSGSVIFKSGK